MELEECKRKAVGMLLDYRNNEVCIKMLETNLQEIEQMYNCNMAVSYDQPGSGKTNKVTSSVENELIRKEQKREKIELELIQRKANKRRIDIALENMPVAQSTLLKMKYIDKMYWKQISQKIPYSEEYIRKQLKYSAVTMLTSYLFPEINKINLFAESPKSPV